MDKPRHPHKDIESALGFAQANGWRLEVGVGRAWGRLYSPSPSGPPCYGESCRVTLWRAPAHPEVQAAALRRLVLAWAMADAESIHSNSCREPHAIYLYAPLQIVFTNRPLRRIDRAAG